MMVLPTTRRASSVRLLVVAVALFFLTSCGGVDLLSSEVPGSADVATVKSVTDGDTFRTTDGRAIRVLGIDSCEMDTNGGKAARAAAKALLPIGSTVELKRERVDQDRYGRYLRYVRISDGRDFGEVMVGAQHTGVYGKKNDASPRYVETLRGLDDGRNCDLR